MNYVTEELLATMREGGVEFYVVVDEGAVRVFEVNRNALVFDHDGEAMNLYSPEGVRLFTINGENRDTFDDTSLSFTMDMEWGSEGFSERVTEEANIAIATAMDAEVFGHE